jgi:menaquinone-dependent protoporphyrinogen oxidase
MISVLIAYAASEGHTAKIAEYIANVIRDHGYEAYPVDLERHSCTLDPVGYDAVIVGASIHMGKHEQSLGDFVRKNRAALERLPSAFFSVSLAAHDNTDDARKAVEGYIERFVHQTGWRPSQVGVFAGALLYTHYGFIKRWIMKKIARDKGNPDTDTSRDYVYTDWNSVRGFAEEFVESLVLAGAPNARG